MEICVGLGERYFLMARAVVPCFIEQGHGKIVNITINHETMTRRGFVPYGPSRAGSEALSRVMEQDLAPYGVTVNQLLPGGATATGMIPDDVPEAVRRTLLDPAVMGPPICFLCSPASDGLTGARIVARDFAHWLREYRRVRADGPPHTGDGGQASERRP
jgi:NAD(P)-dependent dehydrogenase (short-subunit alcohol dehydrogenase family)